MSKLFIDHVSDSIVDQLFDVDVNISIYKYEYQHHIKRVKRSFGDVEISNCPLWFGVKMEGVNVRQLYHCRAIRYTHVLKGKDFKDIENPTRDDQYGFCFEDKNMYRTNTKTTVIREIKEEMKKVLHFVDILQKYKWDFKRFMKSHISETKIANFNIRFEHPQKVCKIFIADMPWAELKYNRHLPVFLKKFIDELFVLVDTLSEELEDVYNKYAKK